MIATLVLGCGSGASCLGRGSGRIRSSVVHPADLEPGSPLVALELCVRLISEHEGCAVFLPYIPWAELRRDEFPLAGVLRLYIFGYHVLGLIMQQAAELVTGNLSGASGDRTRLTLVGTIGGFVLPIFVLAGVPGGPGSPCIAPWVSSRALPGVT